MVQSKYVTGTEILLFRRNTCSHQVDQENVTLSVRMVTTAYIYVES